MSECWKDIVGYEGYYQVSDLGNIRSVDRTVVRTDGKKIRVKGKAIKTFISEEKYTKVQLSKDFKYKNCYVHRLVAESFLTNAYNKPAVNHLDGIKSNNCVSNLEWVTNKENNIHAVKTNLVSNLKLDSEKASEIRKMYLAGGCTQRQLAKIYGVSQRLILYILKGGAWAHAK